MKKRLLATILALSLLAIPKVSFSEEAQSNLNLDKTTTKQEKVPSDINNELVLSKVVSVELNNEKDPKTYLVKCLGVVSNKTNSVLKNVKVKVQIVDINRNVLGEVAVDNIEKIDPSQEKSFKVEKFINTEINKFNIRAISKVDSFEGANLVKIAQWILQGKKEELKYWEAQLGANGIESDTDLRNYAISTLSEVKENDPDYNKAQETINELYYIEGLKGIEVSDFTNAFISLNKVNPNSRYGEMAKKAIDIYRPKLIYEKAKVFIANKNYLKAIPLLRSIPPKSEYYKISKKELKDIYYYLNKKKIGYVPLDVQGYTEDQTRVLQLMETNPEYILTNSPNKNITTWVFPDYSRFSFDSEGKILKSNIYPLF